MTSTATRALSEKRLRKIPLAVKLAYTAFVVVLVPIYWHHYGPANFFYFCDIALLITVVGIWREDPLLISMCTVGILAPQLVWIADYILGFAGIRLVGITAYMFDPSKPVFLRALSLYHAWLPLLLLWLVTRTGYDRRAFLAWSAVAWAAMFIAYFLLPAPGSGAPVVNVDYVYGFSDDAAQTWMPGWAWFSLMLAAVPLLLTLPTDFVLRRLLHEAMPRDG